MKYASLSTFFSLFAVILFSGCGGGGAQEESSSKASVTVAPTIETSFDIEATDVTVNPSPSSTSELVTDEEFVLNSTRDLEVSVDIASLRTERAYINICLESVDGEIDYKNCLLNAPLKNGRLSKILSLGNEIESLSMEVWRYKLNSVPLAYQWSSNVGNQWQISQ